VPGFSCASREEIVNIAPVPDFPVPDFPYWRVRKALPRLGRLNKAAWTARHQATATPSNQFRNQFRDLDRSNLMCYLHSYK
jgi:hypothetical protein